MVCIQRLVTLTLVLSLLFFWGKACFASAPSILIYPQNPVSFESQFEVSATMSGMSAQSIYRLRLVFSKPGTTSYFGSTFNGENWYDGLPSPINYSNFLTITTDNNGVWFGQIQGKIESSDKNFSGESGNYDLKIGRYTQNGSSATWSSPVSVLVNAPSLTPTNSPTPKVPTPTHAASSVDVKIPTPTEIIQEDNINETDSNENNNEIANNQSNLDEIASDSPEVLGTSSSAVSSIFSLPKEKEMVKDESEKRMPLLFFLGGIMLFAGGGSFFFFKKLKKNPESQ